MSNYSNFLTEAISNGNVKFALADLRNAISRYQEAHPDKADEVHDLGIQVVMLSSRLQELERRESMSTISSEDAHIERSSVTYSLLEIVNGWDQDFVSFANGLTHKAPEAPVIVPPAAPLHASRPSGVNKWKWITIGGGGLLGLLFIIGSLSDPPATNQGTPVTGQGTPETAAAAPLTPEQNTKTTGGNTQAETYRMLTRSWQGSGSQQYLDSPEAAAYFHEYGNYIYEWRLTFHSDGTADLFYGNQHTQASFGYDSGLLAIREEDGTTYYTIERITDEELVLIDHPSQYCRWTMRAK